MAATLLGALGKTRLAIICNIASASDEGGGREASLNVDMSTRVTDAFQ